MKQKELICIACPQGCNLIVSKTNNIVTVTGNKCPKGEAYAHQEFECPMRVLTSTVKTNSNKQPRLPVKLSKEIPLSNISEYINEIKKVCCTKPVKPGDILAENILNKGINLIATGEINK